MIDECITTNATRKSLWNTCIIILMAFLTVGVYIFIKDASITGAVLLLIGALGLMFIVLIYIYECMFRCIDNKPLLPC